MEPHEKGQEIKTESVKKNEKNNNMVRTTTKRS